MAINTGRYVVTGGYRNPDGTIVEETQWVPGETIETADNLPHFHTGSNVFSPSEALKFRADGYYNQGDNILGDAYSALWEGSNAYGNTASQINKFYDALANDITAREAFLGGEKYKLANKLTQDLLSQKQYVMDMFGPNGTLTNEINAYYDDLGNYLATDAGRQAAKIAAQGIHSGASLGSIRAQQNEAYNESFSRYVKAKEQEINAKQQIAANLINYMSTLRKEYGDTTNQYIIQQYQRANDLLNTISQSLAKSNIDLASAKLSNSTKASSDLNNILDSLALETKDTDSKGVTKSESDIEKAKENLGKTASGTSSKASNVDWTGLGWRAMTAPYTYLNPLNRVVKGTEGLINSMK